jgi:hypothetical protein
MTRWGRGRVTVGGLTRLPCDPNADWLARHGRRVPSRRPNGDRSPIAFGTDSQVENKSQRGVDMP